jgi:hypothetical protein
VADAIGLLVPGLDPLAGVIVEDHFLAFELRVDFEAAGTVATSDPTGHEFHGVAAVGGALLHAARRIAFGVRVSVPLGPVSGALLVRRLR